VNLRRVLGTAAVTAVLVGGLASCTSINVTAGYGAAFLTGWDNDHYDVDVTDGLAVVSTTSDPNSGNQRLVFWDWAGKPSANQEVCANFAGSTHAVNQEGVALRVVSGDGRTQAITVMKNVYGGDYNTFNMHIWDTAWGGDLPAQSFGRFPLPNMGDPYNPVPLPWRLCAKVVGDVVSFVVWPHTMAPPGYGAPGWGGSATLPPGAPTYGMPGWYAGHLPPGGYVVYNDLVGTPL
jgi:hypothetical protein